MQSTRLLLQDLLGYCWHLDLKSRKEVGNLAVRHVGRSEQLKPLDILVHFIS